MDQFKRLFFKLIKTLSVFLLLFLEIPGCNQTIPASQKEEFFVQLALGEIYFDTGDLDKALTHAKKAHEINPQSEEAASILGFIYLGLADVGIFDLVQKLVDKEKKEKSKDEEGVNKLSVMKNIIGIDESEFLELGEMDIEVPTIPVLVPACANDVRERIEKLKLVNAAIDAICPFVSPVVRLEDEPRHACKSNLLSTRKTSSYLLWALAHFVEGVLFHSVLTYATTNSGKSNLEMRVADIKDFDISNPASFPDFVKNVQSLASLVTKVLPIEEKCSEQYPQTQLVGFVNDMLAVNLAFGQIKGIPEDFTAVISESVKKIQEIRERVDGVQAKAAQASSIKGDLTKKMAAVLSSKIDTVDISKISEAQKEDLCVAYNNISPQIGDQTRTLPKLCQQPGSELN